MEMAHAGSSSNLDYFGEMNAGTAGDHFGLGVAHFKRAIYLAFTGGSSNRPADAADVSDEAPATAAASSSGPGYYTVETNSAADADGGDGSGGPPKVTTAAPNGVFIPTQPWKEVWDLWVLILILYSAVMVPYRICFNAAAEGWLFLFEQTVTLSFITDVCFNFNTAYLDEDERWITNRAMIGQRYMSGWFWIDAPSSVPVELIDLFLEGDSSSLGMLKFLRLFRLLRLLRLLKLGEYISAIEIKFDLNLTFLRILTMVGSMCFLAHMLGCFWFYMAALVGLDEETVTWVQSYDDGSALFAPPDVQYLYSVYWALTTLTTVGYGDITPTNNVERIYSLAALLIGALVFGFMLSSIGSLVAAVDRQAALSEERLDEVKEYMRWRKLPRDLVMRMRRHYTYYYSRKTAFDEEAILSALTPSLRSEVIQHALKDTIGRIHLFSHTLDPMFQMQIFPLLKPLNSSPKEILFCKGQNSQALFFLIKGQVEVISGVDGRVLYRINSGQFFGESVLTGRRRAATHRSATTCELLLISSEELKQLFEKYPREGKIIHSAVLKEHVRKERMRGLSLKLLINRLPDDQKLTKAAIRLQMAWNRACDRMVFAQSDFDADAPAAPPENSASGPVAPSTPGSPNMKGVNFSEKDLGRQLNKLDKLDALVDEVRSITRTLQGGHKSGRKYTNVSA